MKRINCGLIALFLATTVHAGGLDGLAYECSRTNVAGDGIYVLALDGQLFCKRLQLMPGRVLRVTSINTDYPPYDVRLADDGQEEHFEIIGRVVRQGRDR